MRSLFAAALAAHLAGTHALKATVLPQAFADLYGAKCLDGTPPAIYTSLNSSSSTWLLFLEGGGWCFDTTSAGVISNCFGRAAGGGGSSAGIANGSTNNIGGLLSEDPAVNPRFFSSNLVFMHYCDGSSYSSYRPDAIPAPPGLQAAVPGAPAQIWMRGRANLRAVVAYLLEALGMAAGSELVVSGGSAGATGVYLGLEYIREWVPGSLRVAGAPDAGLFLDVSREGTNDTWYRDSFAAAAPIWGGSDISSAGCMAAYPTEAWRCYLPEYNAYYIATPMLISNSPIDMWGLGNILSLGCIPFMDNATHGGMKPCPPAQWGALQVWFDEFHARLDPYLAASPASRSAFIPSCYVHEINVDYCSGQSLPNCRGWAKYLVAPSAGTPGAAPITLQAATTQWFEALFSSGGSYAAALRAGQLAVEAHSRGQAASPAAAAPTVSQWVDATRYPNNPSCYFPPGR